MRNHCVRISCADFLTKVLSVWRNFKLAPFAVFAICLLLSLQVFAGAIVTYHGRIVKPDGSPLESSAVSFKIQVRSPGATSCLLYEETRSIDMHASNGIFVIPIGDGYGTRTVADPAITIENVFSNNSALNFTSLSCNSGTSYSPVSLDARKLVISFDDGSGAGVQTLAPMDINYVPLALHTLQAQTALSVGTTPAANVMTVSGPASALTPSNFTELLALVNGTSTTYAKTSSSVGGDLTGTIASANVVKLQGRAVSSSAPSTNDVLTWNGSAWAPAAGGGGGAVSSVAGRTGAVVLANTDISGLGNASTKNVGTTAGTVAAGDDARFGTASVFTGSFTGDVTGTQSATVVATVGGSTAANIHNADLLANSATSFNTVSTIVRRDSNGDFTSRDVSLRSTIYKDSGSKTVTVLSPTALTNSYTLTWPLDKGTVNQVLTTDASGNLFWSTPAGGGGGGTVTSVTSGGAPIVVTGTPVDPIISVSAATTGASGVVTLAADNTSVASTVVQATDSRLSNARTPSGGAGGDLSSTYPNPTVSGIKGAPITYTSLTTGDVLKYNGSAWINTALSTANLSDSSDLLKVSNMPANCAAGSSLTFSSPSGAWVCTTIPDATTSTKGIVQIGTGLSVASGTVSLTSGVATPGTYTKVTVDTYGRVTTTANIAAGDITGALGYTPVNQAGDVMSGTFGFASYTNTTEATLVAGFGAGDKGKTWFNSDLKKINMWDGTHVVSLASPSSPTASEDGKSLRWNESGKSWDYFTAGAAGAGIGTFNTLTANTQNLAIGTSGTLPNWVSATSTHTLNIPMASTSSVTAGLLSKADYDIFNAKLGTASTFSGDVSGTSSTTSVDKIKGKVVTTPTASGQMLVYDGTGITPVVMSSDATMAATGAVTLKNTGTAGTYYKVTTDAQGRVSSGVAALVAADIPNLDWTKITGTPTTLLGYGISDAVKNAGGTPSVQQGTFASMPAAGTTGRLYVSTDGKKLYRDNGTSWDVISPATAGTVTSVTSGGLPIVVGGTAADPTISVNAATTGASGVVTLSADNATVASTVVQATDSRLSNARAPSGGAGGDLSSTYPNPTVSGIKGATITYTSLTTGDFLKYNGTAWVNTALSSANLSNNSDLLKVSQMPANCAAGSSLTFSSPTGTWVCTTIPSATTAVAGIVTLSADNATVASTVVQATDTRLTNARAPSGTAGGDLSSTYPNPTVSKINNVGLSFSSLTSGDYLKYNGTNWINESLPAGASYWTAATGGINYAGGNVGIGTTAPYSKFHVVTSSGGTMSGGSGPIFQDDVVGAAWSNLYVIGGATGGASVNFGTRTGFGNGFISYDNALNSMNFATNNTGTKMTISSSGNVGIGTTTPGAALHVFGSGSGSAPAASGSTDATMNERVCRGSVCVDTGMMDSGTGYVQVRSVSNFATNYNLAINPNGGNVGIGTTAPAVSLDVGSRVDSIRIPAGTTAQRPASPVSGDIRYNSTTGKIEAFEGGSWRYMVAGRDFLTADRTYYVRVDGNDSNTGLTNSSGGAFLTIQKAIDTIAGTLDIGNRTITIQLGDGTYTAGALVTGPFFGSGGTVLLKGNAATPANTVISPTSGAAINVTGGGSLKVESIEVRTVSGEGVLAAQGSTVTGGTGMRFGTCGSAQIRAKEGGRIIFESTAFNVVGGATYHLYSSPSGYISLFGTTITVTGTPNFTNAFAMADRLSFINAGSTVISGAATGTRYTSSNNSVIFVGGAGVNFFPGSVAGSALTGGQYN